MDVGAVVKGLRLLTGLWLPSGFSAVQGGAAAAFTPASLNLSSYVQAAYAGAPWPGRASAGISGGNPYVSVGADPTVGAAVNGFATASFDGTQSDLSGDTAAHLFTNGNGTTTGSGSVGILFRSTAIPAQVGPNNLNGNLLSDLGDAEIACGYVANGATPNLNLSLDNNGTQTAIGAGARGVGAWIFAQFRWGPTTMELRANGDAWTTAAGTWVNQSSGTMFLGTSYAGQTRFTGVMAAVFTSPLRLADADFSNFLSYFRTTFALALT